jgi:hypothetical protein
MDSATEDKQLGGEIKNVQCVTKDNSTTAQTKMNCHMAGRILGRESTKVLRVTTETESENVGAFLVRFGGDKAGNVEQDGEHKYHDFHFVCILKTAQWELLCV